MRLRAVRVLVNGRTVVTRSGAALARPVRLRLRGRRATVTVLATTTSGRSLRQTRRFDVRRTR
jgi:hypothetical protein